MIIIPNFLSIPSQMENYYQFNCKEMDIYKVAFPFASETTCVENSGQNTQLKLKKKRLLYFCNLLKDQSDIPTAA